MTTDDQLLRRVTAYLDECEGTTILPESILDGIRAELPTTRQSRPSGLARFLDMSTPVKIGVAAAVLAVAAILSLNWLGTTRFGPPPAGSEQPTPSAGGSGTASLLPPELQHPFLGPDAFVEGVDHGGAGDLDLSSGILHLEDADTTLITSTAHVTADGRLRFENAVTDLCAVGDVGLYAYSLSEGGTFLTVENGTDDCSARADSVPGTYQRSDCWTPDDWCLGVLEAATYRSQFIEPRVAGDWKERHGALTFTVPEGWAAYADWPSTYGLTPRSEYERPRTEAGCFDCPGDRDTISVLVNPDPAAEDCSEAAAPGVGSGIDELADWLAGHPGLTTTEPVRRTIGGLDAITLVIEGSSEWTGTCEADQPFVAVPIFFGQDGYHSALAPGNHYEVTLIDLADGNAVAVIVDAGIEADFESFVAEARPIVDSFEFPPR
jgi:hypothetical protein